jgi:serine/threonine-protein kinase
MKTCPVCDTPYPDNCNTCPTDGASLIETRELVPGHLVRGKYRILRTLGAGGMGTVYLAEHLMLGGQVALKFLATELSRNPSFIKRFRQEARAAYHLRHPNIVEVADLDQDESGSLFIAMEFVDGPSLRSAIHGAPRGLPVTRALHIARGVVAGLAAAHARGAIHRDIKPENILLGAQPDGSEQAKVLDFGIAAMTEGITNLSHTRGLMLTPEYAAPEQWRGTPAAELDGRTDLYALGGVYTRCSPGARLSRPGTWKAGCSSTCRECLNR